MLGRVEDLQRTRIGGSNLFRRSRSTCRAGSSSQPLAHVLRIQNFQGLPRRYGILKGRFTYLPSLFKTYGESKLACVNVAEVHWS